MNKIPFMKLSGAGNDFVIINNLNKVIDSTESDFMSFVTKVCERRMSVGADGIPPCRISRRCYPRAMLTLECVISTRMAVK